jgi:hypothetical protein
MSANCKLNPAKDIADCTGQYISDRETTIVSGIEAGYSELIEPVIVTAGVEKLSATASLTASLTTTKLASSTTL